MGRLVPDAIERARARLGLQWPVDVHFANPRVIGSLGRYTLAAFPFEARPRHVVQLGEVGHQTDFGPLTPAFVNENLWHELVHARQAEEYIEGRFGTRLPPVPTNLGTSWPSPSATTTTTTWDVTFGHQDPVYARSFIYAWEDHARDHQASTPYWDQPYEVEARAESAALRDEALIEGAAEDRIDFVALHERMEAYCRGLPTLENFWLEGLTGQT
jgi:hypothetical protein